MEIPTPPSPPPITAAVIHQSDPPPLNTTTNQPTPPLTNGVLKRHKPNHHHHQPPPVEVVSYKECLKNHAATIGGHAVDGCGEFMPSPTSSSADPTSLRCAACGCHRNFHRRDPDESLLPSHNHHLLAITYQPHHRHHPPPPSQPLPPPTAGSPGNSPSPPPISSSYYPHMALALTTVPALPPADNNHIPAIPTTPLSGGACGSNPDTKKRFRTKFTQDQKKKMQEMAERVDWKILKRDEDTILEFCNEIGVDRNVFKVWMHNNKANFGSKKDFVDKMNGIDFIISRNNDHHGTTGNNRVDHQLHLYKNGGFSGGENVVCSTKGSSSSS